MAYQGCKRVGQLLTFNQCHISTSLFSCLDINMSSRHAKLPIGVKITHHNRECEMWGINNGRSVKRDGIFQVLARFNASSYLPDVFISELEEAISYLLQDSGKRQKHSSTKSKLSTYIVVHHCKEVCSFRLNSSTWFYIQPVKKFHEKIAFSKTFEEPFWRCSSGHRCRNCIQDQDGMGPQEGSALPP